MRVRIIYAMGMIIMSTMLWMGDAFQYMNRPLRRLPQSSFVRSHRTGANPIIFKLGGENTGQGGGGSPSDNFKDSGDDDSQKKYSTMFPFSQQIQLVPIVLGFLGSVWAFLVYLCNIEVARAGIALGFLYGLYQFYLALKNDFKAGLATSDSLEALNKTVTSMKAEIDTKIDNQNALFNSKIDNQSALFNSKIDNQSALFNSKIDNQNALFDSKIDLLFWKMAAVMAITIYVTKKA